MATNNRYFRPLLMILRLMGLIATKQDRVLSFWTPRRLVLIIHMSHLVLWLRCTYHQMFNTNTFLVVCYVLVNSNANLFIICIFRRQSLILQLYRDFEEATDEKTERIMRLCAALMVLACFGYSLSFPSVVSYILWDETEFDSYVHEMGLQSLCGLSSGLCTAIVFFEGVFAWTLTIGYSGVGVFAFGALLLNQIVNMRALKSEIISRAGTNMISTTDDIIVFRKKYSNMSRILENIEIVASLPMGITCFLYGLGVFGCIASVFHLKSSHLTILNNFNLIVFGLALAVFFTVGFYIILALDDPSVFPINTIRMVSAHHSPDDIDFGEQSEALVQLLLDFPRLTMAKFFPLNRKSVAPINGAIWTYLMSLMSLDKEFHDSFVNLNSQ